MKARKNQRFLVSRKSKKFSKKSQAALEFLTTYVWAFFVILVMIGALFYFGIFDFSKLLPQRCLFPSQFECIDFSFAADGGAGPPDVIRFKLINNIGEEVDVHTVDITNDAVNPLSCPTRVEPSGLPATGWKPGDEREFEFANCKDGSFIGGERTEALVTITYCAPATAGCDVEDPDVMHTINGKITAIVLE